MDINKESSSLTVEGVLTIATGGITEEFTIVKLGEKTDQGSHLTDGEDNMVALDPSRATVWLSPVY